MNRRQIQTLADGFLEAIDTTRLTASEKSIYIMAVEEFRDYLIMSAVNCLRHE